MVELGKIHISLQPEVSPFMLQSYFGLAAMPKRSLHMQALMCFYLGYLGFQLEHNNLQSMVLSGITQHKYVLIFVHLPRLTRTRRQLDIVAVWTFLHRAMCVNIRPLRCANTLG